MFSRLLILLFVLRFVAPLLVFARFFPLATRVRFDDLRRLRRVFRLEWLAYFLIGSLVVLAHVVEGWLASRLDQNHAGCISRYKNFHGNPAARFAAIC